MDHQADVQIVVSDFGRRDFGPALCEWGDAKSQRADQRGPRPAASEGDTVPTLGPHVASTHGCTQ